MRLAPPALAPLAAVLALLPLQALAQDTAPPAAPALPRVLSVTGEGHATAKPDLARISLGVGHQAETAEAAMAMMAEGMQAVLARLAQEGIASSDVRTGQLMLEPAWNYNTPDGNPVMTGFVATQVVDVTVRDLDQVGGVLDAVVQDGANRVNGVMFDLAEPREALNEARRDAVADARARAEVYAEAAGVALGDLVSVSDTAAFAPMPMFDARGGAEAAAAVPVAPGQLTLTAVVTMTWALAD
jgi:uncharacterized protein YggE